MTTTVRIVKKQAKKVELVLITNELLRKIVIDRLEDGKGGFQRRLDEQKVVGVLDTVKDGVTVPPIMLAEVDGALICLDGQHRLEARRRKEFALYAQISPMSKREAAESFVIHNGTVSKVSRRHRILVDPGEYATHIRSLAKSFKGDVAQIEPLLSGITSGRSRNMDVKNGDFTLAREILEHWAKDRRWTSGVKHGKKRSIYAAPATLKMVGSLCKENPKNVAAVTKALKTIDFTASSSFGKKAGCGNTKQADMKQYTLKVMFKNGLVGK